MTSTATHTVYINTDEPCRRRGCHQGVWMGRGICFRCNGSGYEVVAVERPLTDAEIAAVNEYQAGIAARERREAERAARRAERKAAQA